MTADELDVKVGTHLDAMTGALEAHAGHVLFRLERMEQALLTYADLAGSQPTHAAQELGRIMRLPQQKFNDEALARREAEITITKVG